MRNLSDYEKRLSAYDERLICEGVDEPDYDVVFDRKSSYTTLGPDCFHDMLILAMMHFRFFPLCMCMKEAVHTNTARKMTFALNFFIRF